MSEETKLTKREQQGADYRDEALVARNERIREVMEAIELELRRATASFNSFHNTHEGYAVLLEEVDELWDEIKASKPKSFFWRTGYGDTSVFDKGNYNYQQQRIGEEATQVGAMAARILLDLIEPLRELQQ